MISPDLERKLVLEHGGLAILADEFDAGGDGFRDSHGFFTAVEITAAHVRDAGLRIGGPLAHPVRVFARKLLDRQRGTAIGVSFAQHRVNCAAQHLAITRPDFLLGFGLRVFRIVGDPVSLRLQFADRRLELRERCADIGQLDDVCFRFERQRAQFAEVIGNFLARGQVFREIREDAASQGNVPRFDGNTGRAGKGLDDGEQGIGGQCRRFVGQCVDDFLTCHDFLFSSCLAIGRLRFGMLLL